MGNNLKPFNLQDALAGKQVVTREGKKVTELHLFKGGKLLQPLFGIIENEEGYFCFNKDGMYNYSSKETSYDLFMADEKKSVWVNVYKLTNGEMCIGCSYSSLKDAMRYTDGDGTYLKTIEITNEP